MVGLKAKLADDAVMAVVLGLQDDEGRGDDELKTAFETAGSAVERERELDLTDALVAFPCTALIGAGRDLMRVWSTQLAALQRVIEVGGMLQEDLRLNEGCLDDSGQLSLEKTRVVEQLGGARKRYTQALTAMETLTPVMRNGDDA